MEPPIVLALLLCDHVWRDPDSGMHSKIGTFSGVGGFAFRGEKGGGDKGVRSH